MKKLTSIVSLLALLGAGCFSSPTPAPTPAPSPTPAAGHPPAVMMSVNDVSYPGVEGSYCYGGTCVDKIGPPALVADAELGFKAVARNSQASFSVGGEVFEFGVTMTDASGTDLGLRMPVSFREGKYTAKIPNLVGHHLLIAHVRFGTTGGDDVSYIFPLNIR